MERKHLRRLAINVVARLFFEILTLEGRLVGGVFRLMLTCAATATARANFMLRPQAGQPGGF
jgi:hypothetical protein